MHANHSLICSEETFGKPVLACMQLVPTHHKSPQYCWITNIRCTCWLYDRLEFADCTYRYSAVLTSFEKLPLTTIRNPLIMRLTSPMLQNRITITSTSIKIAKPATPMTHPADPNVRSPSGKFENEETVPSRLRVPNATAAATSAGRAATWVRTVYVEHEARSIYYYARALRYTYAGW